MQYLNNYFNKHSQNYKVAIPVIFVNTLTPIIVIVLLAAGGILNLFLTSNDPVNMPIVPVGMIVPFIFITYLVILISFAFKLKKHWTNTTPLIKKIKHILLGASPILLYIMLCLAGITLSTRGDANTEGMGLDMLWLVLMFYNIATLIIYLIVYSTALLLNKNEQAN